MSDWYYVVATWEEYPDTGSYADIVYAEDADASVAQLFEKMAESRGVDAKDYEGEWNIALCTPVSDVLRLMKQRVMEQ